MATNFRTKTWATNNPITVEDMNLWEQTIRGMNPELLWTGNVSARFTSYHPLSEPLTHFAEVEFVYSSYSHENYIVKRFMVPSGLSRTYWEVPILNGFPINANTSNTAYLHHMKINVAAGGISFRLSRNQYVAIYGGSAAHTISFNPPNYYLAFIYGYNRIAG